MQWHLKKTFKASKGTKKFWCAQNKKLCRDVFYEAILCKPCSISKLPLCLCFKGPRLGPRTKSYWKEPKRPIKLRQWLTRPAGMQTRCQLSIWSRNSCVQEWHSIAACNMLSMSGNGMTNLTTPYTERLQTLVKQKNLALVHTSTLKFSHHAPAWVWWSWKRLMSNLKD